LETCGLLAAEFASGIGAEELYPAPGTMRSMVGVPLAGGTRSVPDTLDSGKSLSTIYLVSVAEGTFFDFAQLGRLAFCGLAEVGVARWAKRAV
jgi:hypothetical protein